MEHTITVGDVVVWVVDGGIQAIITVLIVLVLREMLRKPPRNHDPD